VRLLDTLAVCYRGRRITSEGSESHRPRGAMTGAEGAVSALGHKRTLERGTEMSASPPRADVPSLCNNVC
jgi:hypothetical protein